jgi:hypothetical protein
LSVGHVSSVSLLYSYATCAGKTPAGATQGVSRSALSASSGNNEQFKGIFEAHQQVPTKGLVETRRFALGPFSCNNSLYCTVSSTVWNSRLVSKLLSVLLDL